MRDSAPSGGTVLHNGDVRLFGTSRFLTGLAYQMRAVAAGWCVYDLTRSARALGLVGLAGFLPAMLAASITGHVADTDDRRLVAAAAFAVQAGTSAALPAYAWRGASAVSSADVSFALAASATAAIRFRPAAVTERPAVTWACHGW